MRAAAAQLGVYLTCLFLCEDTCMVAHGSQLRLQTTKLHTTAVRRREARHTAALQQASAHSLPSMPGSLAPGVSAEEFLAGCNFTTAEMPGERVKWHSGRSACRILGKLDRLVFVGDSLTRQLYEALIQLLREDLPRGALRSDTPADMAERCSCNEQGDPACAIHTEAWPDNLGWMDGAPLVSREVAPCPNAPAFRMMFFHQYGNWIHEPASRDTMVQVRYIACQWPNSLVFVAGAPSHPQRERDSDPWAKMEGGFSVRHLIQPMRLMAEQCMIPAENLVWAPVHWMDMAKVPVEEWLGFLNTKNILTHNRISVAAARAANLTVFDTYNLTKDSATLDGTHVPVTVSLAKLQRLLGMLEERQAAALDHPAGAST